MTTVVLVAHLMIAIALVAVVLLQRSEGGALGIGGGGGGMVTGRSAANILTRVTAGLAAAFFATSITLTVLSQQSLDTESILDSAANEDVTVPEPIDEPAQAPEAPDVPLAQ